METSRPKKVAELIREVIAERESRGESASELKKLLKNGGTSLYQAVLKLAKKCGVDEDKIRNFENYCRLTGELFESIEKAKEALRKINEHISGTDLEESLKQFPDDPRYASLKSVALIMHPAVRSVSGDSLDNLYRKIMFAGMSGSSGTRSSGDKTERRTKPDDDLLGAVPEDNGVAANEVLMRYEKLLTAIERKEFLGQGDSPHSKEYSEIFKMLVLKMLEIDTFADYKRDPERAIGRIDARMQKLKAGAKSERDLNAVDAYSNLLRVYDGALKLEFPGLNKEFVDPFTGRKGVLPSPHQRIACYHQMEELRFGVFDACGTGKTAIAALSKLLFEISEGRLVKGEDGNWTRKEGAKPIKTLVICPDKAKRDAWRKGLIGDTTQRFFEEKQNVLFINGGKKRELLFSSDADRDVFNQQLAAHSISLPGEDVLNSIMSLEDGAELELTLDGKHYAAEMRNGKLSLHESTIVNQIENADWVVVNYEQLITKVNGETLAEYLEKVGFDYVIIDEVHNLKKKEPVNLKKNSEGNVVGFRLSLSGAARLVANKAKMLCLLSATPMPDNLDDYSVPYSLLCPDICPDPSKFIDIYHANPRILFTFTNEKTIRRNAEDVNSELEFEEKYIDIPMDQTQRMIYENIVPEYKRRPPSGDWLTQARKALLDPRMVNHGLKEELNLNVKIENSAKFQALVKMLTSESGPLSRGEKVVVFSSQFKEGITRASEELGIKDEETFRALLEKAVREKFPGVEIGVLDGNTGMADDGNGESERSKLCDRFNDKEGSGKNLKILLCTTETAGESIDLTSASTVIFLDEDYSPATKIQAVSRVLRKGQKSKVRIYTLRCLDSLDMDITEYVITKALFIKIALDGHPLLPEEERLLMDTENRSLKDLISSRIKSKPIDIDAVRIDMDERFVTRVIPKARKRSSQRAMFLSEEEYETTAAQQIRLRIGTDPKCWFDKQFVDFYCQHIRELSVWLVHRAKVCFLLSKAKRGEIDFPRNVVSMGSGPSLLFNAYDDMGPLIKNAGFRAPLVTDIDYSPQMLAHCKNERKALGDMTGCGLEAESVDMVDNESITLLGTREETKKAIQDADRILRKGGLLLLVAKNLRFKSQFYEALKEAGYELLTADGEAIELSADWKKEIKAKEGEHYSEAYARKLNNTFVLLARKGEPKKPIAEMPKESFWFEKLGGGEAEAPPIMDANAIERDDESAPERNGNSSKRRDDEERPKRKRSTTRTHSQHLRW